MLAEHIELDNHEESRESDALLAHTDSNPASATSRRSTLDPCRGAKSLNVVLLGEFGAGKSTLINSFANFVCTEAFEDVNPQEFVTQIPGKFQILDRQGILKTVAYGEVAADDSEGTKICRTYTMKCGSRVVRLVDTPGAAAATQQTAEDIGSCIEYLKKNFRDFHALCIVMRADSPNAGLITKKCLTAIATGMPNKVRKNVVFVFIRPPPSTSVYGRTKDEVRRALDELREHRRLDVPFSEDNTFFFDNQGFRYLVAIRNGVDVEEAVRKDAAESWSRNTEEVVRFFSYILSLEPSSLEICTSKQSLQGEASRLAEFVANAVVAIARDLHESTAEVLIKSSWSRTTCHRFVLDVGKVVPTIGSELPAWWFFCEHCWLSICLHWMEYKGGLIVLPGEVVLSPDVVDSPSESGRKVMAQSSTRHRMDGDRFELREILEEASMAVRYLEQSPDAKDPVEEKIRAVIYAERNAPVPVDYIVRLEKVLETYRAKRRQKSSTRDPGEAIYRLSKLHRRGNFFKSSLLGERGDLAVNLRLLETQRNDRLMSLLDG